jgi:uncharacterized membrane protein YqaE (UPF0057 family)
MFKCVFCLAAALVLAALIVGLGLAIPDPESVLSGDLRQTVKCFQFPPVCVRLASGVFVASLLLTLLAGLVPFYNCCRWVYGQLMDRGWTVPPNMGRDTPPVEQEQRQLMPLDDTRELECPNPECREKIPHPITGLTPGVWVRCMRGCERDYIVM